MDLNSRMPTSSQPDRKITERNRRNRMKTLYSRLDSLVPHVGSREGTSLMDRLDEATNYIKSLQMALERMREKKESLLLQMEEKKNAFDMDDGMTKSTGRQRAPHVEIHEMGSTIQIVLRTGLDCRFMFTALIRLLHETQVEIVTASFSVVEDTVLHTIHSKIGDSETKPEMLTRISEMVKQTVHNAYPF